MRIDPEVMSHEAFVDFDAFRTSASCSSSSAEVGERVAATVLLAGLAILGGIVLSS